MPVESWVVDILKGYGLAGVVIFMLLIVIVYREKFIRSMGTDLKGMHEARAKEREALAVLVERATATASAQTAATAERNAVIEDLAGTIVKQTSALESFRGLLEMRQEIFANDMAAMKAAFETFSSSHRVIAAVVEDIRNALPGLSRDVNEAKADAKKAAELASDAKKAAEHAVQAAQQLASRRRG